MGGKLKPEDYIGKKYNHLTVIRQTDKKKGSSYLWEFQCDCGNTYYNIMSLVKNNNTKSCGCMKSIGLIKYNESQRSIKIGDKFGKLTVIEELGLRPYTEGHSRMWYKCQCECGNIVEKNGNILKNGQTKSCGCLKSAGEHEIENLLKENNIKYLTEYVDNLLVEETGRRLRFDFAILDEKDHVKYFIEFQGRQHTEGFDTDIFSNAEPLEKIQERDEIKRQFCRKHQIRLIEIPFQKKGKICIQDLI